MRGVFWGDKNPVVQQCLDFWLISSSLQEDVESVDVIPVIKSDHSAITLLTELKTNVMDPPFGSSMQA